METQEIPLDNQTYADLEKLAKIHNVTIDEMARRLLEKFMRQYGC